MGYLDSPSSASGEDLFGARNKLEGLSRGKDRRSIEESKKIRTQVPTKLRCLSDKKAGEKRGGKSLKKRATVSTSTIPWWADSKKEDMRDEGEGKWGGSPIAHIETEIFSGLRKSGTNSADRRGHGEKSVWKEEEKRVSIILHWGRSHGNFVFSLLKTTRLEERFRQTFKEGMGGLGKQRG